jgi:hypothetical protein
MWRVRARCPGEFAEPLAGLFPSFRAFARLPPFGRSLTFRASRAFAPSFPPSVAFLRNAPSVGQSVTFRGVRPGTAGSGMLVPTATARAVRRPAGGGGGRGRRERALRSLAVAS